MKTGLLISSFLTGIIVVGCADAGGIFGDDQDADESEPEATEESELRSFVAGELVGAIACGETKRIHHSGTPTYRALSIAATKGQTLDLKVSALGADARAWLTTASNAAVASNDDSNGSRDSRITYKAKSTTKHHIVFREKNYEEDVDFDVTLACTNAPSPTPDAGPAADAASPPPSVDAGPGPSTNDPFDPTSCTGPTIAKTDAIAKIGAGNAFKTIAPATRLRSRKRSCNTVTGCSAWAAPADASHLYYMASGSDNYNVQRPYDVNLRFAVIGNDIHAVVSDISNEAKCPGCTPSGIQVNLATGALQDHYGNAALFIYYPRWNHGSSGFYLGQEWASVPLGPRATTSFTVTSTCARASVLSKDLQTEYAVLYRY